MCVCCLYSVICSCCLLYFFGKKIENRNKPNVPNLVEHVYQPAENGIKMGQNFKIPNFGAQYFIRKNIWNINNFTAFFFRRQGNKQENFPFTLVGKFALFPTIASCYLFQISFSFSVFVSMNVKNFKIGFVCGTHFFFEYFLASMQYAGEKKNKKWESNSTRTNVKLFQWIFSGILFWNWNWNCSSGVSVCVRLLDWKK